MILDTTAHGPVTLTRPSTGPGAVPRTFGPGALLVTAGIVLVVAAVRGDGLGFDGAALLPLYCLGLLFIGVLLWWEATRRGTGVLPSWTSPPALIAGWALAWIYAPAIAPFFDSSLIGDYERMQGGEAVLVTGLPLTCVGLAVLSCSYHAASRLLRSNGSIAEQIERYVPLRRVVAVYALGTLARAARLNTLGVAFGADLAGWGPLRSADQLIGYVEDLRFLALALLVAHVVRRRGGYFWLAIPLIVEFMWGVSSGFLTPVVMAVLLCVATAAAFERLRARHVAVMASAALVVSTFMPVIAAIREDRLGAIGTADLIGVGEVLTTPAKYWLAGVSAGDGVYNKFFGRQTEVAAATGLVVSLTPSVVPYEGIDRFLTLPASLIPRVLWPDKPTLSRGVWFSSTFRGFKDDTTSYSAMTIFSEGYLFYGWTGAVLAMAILGVALAVVRCRLDNPRLVLVYLALVPTILQIEPEFSSYITTLIQRSVVFLVVFVLLTKRVPAGFERSQIQT
jgi:hypothetical protein